MRAARPALNLATNLGQRLSVSGQPVMSAAFNKVEMACQACRACAGMLSRRHASAQQTQGLPALIALATLRV